MTGNRYEEFAVRLPPEVARELAVISAVRDISAESLVVSALVKELARIKSALAVQEREAALSEEDALRRARPTGLFPPMY